jgi:septum formation protein
MTELTKRIYLASQSPRRRELLKLIGVDFAALMLRSSPGRQDVVEIPLTEESPADFALRMASEKSQCGWKVAGLRGLAAFPVLGADTVVDLDGEILGKPRDREHAASVLLRLSGRTHWVHTGVAMTRTDETRTLISSSKVTFAPLSEDTIRRYLETGEYLDKAGAYGIQGRAGLFISRIEGSYTGIMGLPLHETGLLLNWAGITI